MLALIDYGAGNLTSVRKGFAAVGASLFPPACPSDLRRAAGIIVPGVGHFGATGGLAEGWREAIGEAIAGGTPLLGICLGLQWLFDGSDEAPGLPGLGAIAGRCVRLPPTLKVPHVGWNSLRISSPSRLLDGVSDGSQVYFTHSYAAPLTAATTAVTTHSAPFSAVVETGHVFGVQFHPEKSAAAGLRILSNFVTICSPSG